MYLSVNTSQEHTETNNEWIVVVKAAKKLHLKNGTAMSLSGNHDPVTQDNPQWAISVRVFCFYRTRPTNRAEGRMHLFRDKKQKKQRGM